MSFNRIVNRLMTVIGLTAGLMLANAAPSHAHCDTMDGPVVRDARTALESGNITPVLKWVKEEGEAEIREAFQSALAVRKTGDEARKLADRYFFETLVRVHRAGEGAPFTGLKPSGSEIEPSVRLADEALDSGSVETLAEKIGSGAAQGVRSRFEHALEARKHAEHNVAAGREYVEAYVMYVHYVEGLTRTISAGNHELGAVGNTAAHEH